MRIETDEGKAMLIKAERRLALVPRRFNADAEAVLDRGVVSSPAFAAWAHKVHKLASAVKKRRRKMSERSKTRNRR